MQFDMDHPVIVTRRKRWDHEAQYALVRATSRIEIPDYALDDVRTAATMHHGNGVTTYRKIGDRIFKQLDHMPAAALKSGTDMAEALIGRGTTFDFGSFMRHVQMAAIELADETNTLSKNVAYMDRPLTRQEQRHSSSTSLLKAFAKAPVMGSQLWLGPDADSQKYEWADRLGHFMTNVALVDGVVHVRAFEPCISMRLGRGNRYMGFDKLGYMEQVLGDARTRSRHGVPYLGSGGDEAGRRCFSLNEFDRAVGLAEDFGCINEVVLDTHTTGFTLIDPGALSDDFLEEETYRVAVHALQIAHDIENDLAGQSYATKADIGILDARLREIGLRERALICLVAPGTKLEADAMASATQQLLSVLRRDGEFLSSDAAGYLAQVEASFVFLEARRDSMPIHIDPVDESRFRG